MSRADLAQFETAALTHPGTRSGENQDAYLAGTASGIWAVADGMGGHDDGRHASHAVIDALGEVPPQDSAALLLRACEARVLTINATLVGRAAQDNTTIGTTLAALLTHDMHYACVWAGDSRIYRVRHDRIVLVTHDHTEVQDLVDRGLLTEQERRLSPRRNVITRAIGVSLDVELEITQGLLQQGDTFLLCSDGLTNDVADAELLSILAGRPVGAACRALIDLALGRGGADNMTAVVVRYGGSSTVVPSGPDGPWP